METGQYLSFFPKPAQMLKIGDGPAPVNIIIFRTMDTVQSHQVMFGPKVDRWDWVTANPGINLLQIIVKKNWLSVTSFHISKENYWVGNSTWLQQWFILYSFHPSGLQLIPTPLNHLHPTPCWSSTHPSALLPPCPSMDPPKKDHCLLTCHPAVLQGIGRQHQEQC